jgi:DNA (cytosine-5)-methyltransferase 1
MIFSQHLLDLNGELLVDLFAGGGGASAGIEAATGRTVDIAINHDAAAVAMHRVNHPTTDHHVCDVFEVDPREVTQGRPIGLLWASPDCTYHSKARGAKPIRSGNRKRRALAWVVTRWAGQVRPRVIMLENVEEFAEWGPLAGPPDQLRPCPRRRGRTFRRWVRSLTRLGYQVEWRELRACDYGAPTIRKRLFVIARRDGQPIVWPESTHGAGRALPYRTAAECIDWSIPMLSIFATREEAKAWGRMNGQAAPVRPLAEATQRRIARGVMRYVVNNPRPFIVGVGGRQGQSPPRGLDTPFQTITAKADSVLVAPIIGEHATPPASDRCPPTLRSAPSARM